MPFVHGVTARFYEVDRAGILFFGRVFEMCHAAYEELLAAAGCDIDRLLALEVGMPLVHAEADFKRPIRLNDRLAVAVEVARASERSVTFAFTLRGAGGADDVRATAKHVHAFVGLRDFSAAAMPEPLDAGLRRLGLIP